MAMPETQPSSDARTAMCAAFLAILAPLSLVVIAVALVFVDVPEPRQRVLDILLGALISLAKDVYGFEFGSSRGSREKDLAKPSHGG